MCCRLLLDTHNEFRFAVTALSGGLLITIYARSWQSVRRSMRMSIRAVLPLNSVRRPFRPMGDPWTNPPEDLEQRLQKHLRMAAKLDLPTDSIRRYAHIHIAAEEVVQDRRNQEQRVRDEAARTAAFEHGICVDDPKRARVAYGAACRAQQEVHASATGCSLRLTKLETLLETHFRSLQIDIAHKFPLPELLSASKLIKEFAVATAPHPNWADLKIAKSELSLTVPGHTFMWWRTTIQQYNGKSNDMFRLARCWRITDVADIATFQRLVRKLKRERDRQGRTYILRCPQWALPNQVTP